jgi:hypothetical protein
MNWRWGWAPNFFVPLNPESVSDIIELCYTLVYYGKLSWEETQLMTLFELLDVQDMLFAFLDAEKRAREKALASMK